ncbi:MAG: hypothetical protein EZS28_054559, partial [Streblomastix strix]
ADYSESSPSLILVTPFVYPASPGGLLKHDFRFHILTVKSLLNEARIPSCVGFHCTQLTNFWCPTRQKSLFQSDYFG